MPAADRPPLASRVVELARAELGVHEATGHNDGLPAERYAGGRREPWCSHFVCWLFRQAGQPLPGDVIPTPDRANPLASVQYLEEHLHARGWLVGAPLPGDVVFFARRGKSDQGPGRHVGLVEEAAIHMIRTIEGNAGDRVERVSYRRSTLEQVVTSYARVPDLHV